MKKGFNHNGNRVSALRSARRVAALVLALLMVVPANLATVLAEAIQPPPLMRRAEPASVSVCRAVRTSRLILRE